MQRHILEKTTPAQRITISSRFHPSSTQSGVSNNGIIRVHAPLPDNFGMTVGSEYGSPFDAGSLNEKLSKFMAATNIAQKGVISMERRFMNPERSEISFEMEFNAFYDAKTEVLIPVISMMSLAIGRRLDWPSLQNTVKNLLDSLATGANAVGGAFGFDAEALTADLPEGLDDDTPVAEGANRLFEMITIIQGPPPVKISFGDVMTLPDCFISSVGVQFRNTLDPDGIPLSAKCNVTAIFKAPLIAENLGEMFDFRRNRG